MPWVPELFTAPVLEGILEKRRRDELVAVPYFDGLMAGDRDALVESFAGEPELYDPVRGRIRGTRAFDAFVGRMSGWLAQRNAVVDDAHLVFGRRGVEEVVVHVDSERGRVDLPVAIVVDHAPDGRLEELRVYFSGWALTGRHATRPPVLQPDPALREADVVGVYQRALAAGDVDAIVGAFEPDGYAREPAGGEYVHRGPDGLRGFYGRMFSDGGGIPLEKCAMTDNGRACLLEYNVVRWGRSELPPQAGCAVYARGESGRLAAARIYDDVEPPLIPSS